MPLASIVIKANPVTAWEQYSLTLDRRMFSRARFSHRDIGGDWEASFDVHPDLLTRELVGDFLYNGLVRQVEMYNDKGIRDWIGIISRLNYRDASLEREANINLMANRVWVRYNSGGSATRSTVLNNTDSQDRYNIKERPLVGGPIALASADAYAQRVLDWTSWPSPGTRRLAPGRAPSSPSFTIRCKGYWHTLGWATYTQTGSTGDADASTVVQAIVDDADVGQFLRTKSVDTNTLQVPQEYDTDRNGANILTDITELGDGAFHKWVAGVTGDREFYYKQGARPER